MNRYQEIRVELEREPHQWLVTGAAGFIGSHLTERLLEMNQHVVGLDNFVTGQRSNVDAVKHAVGAEPARRYRFIEGDIRDLDCLREAMTGARFVLHEAALGSVPRSMEDPLESHGANVDGFINVLIAARDAGVQRVVYASSSSVYGDDDASEKVESRIGQPLSPYAATKRVDEVYAATFLKAYGLDSVGLRYFNVFGPRQDPQGPYAAVIPRWAELLLRGKPCLLYGDGNKSRDFCYVENVVQANILAALVPPEVMESSILNIACGAATSLSELFELIRDRVACYRPGCMQAPLLQKPARPGDISHSLADISLARRMLEYEPTWSVPEGLDQTIPWFAESAPFTRKLRSESKAA